MNGEAITDGDIARRIALLKLEEINGELGKRAEQELIMETLKSQEIAKYGMILNEDTINYFFAQHARNNGMSEKDFISLLNEKGVGENHFKKYLAIQLTWGDFIKRDFMFKHQNIEREMPPNIQKMKNNTRVHEYLIRIMIFSIPDDKIKNEDFINKRMDEAQESRFKFPKDCNNIENFASKIHDVSVSKPQYIVEYDLNPRLQELLKKEENNTTDPYVTERGVEYIAICSKKDLNGEIALQEYFKNHNIPTKMEKHSEEYMEKLRSNANIHYY
ncbi:peptidylprolyl isomerase [Candidatus Liberibacter africanus]|uniref:peptidylprolyl isomerase n=1 Tax=Liberibacter africanus TaxID=34020 RepID=UPI001FCD2B2D|nr:peptidylprolyl isomerase [Candidatus Liberibacter africanus]